MRVAGAHGMLYLLRYFGDGRSLEEPRHIELDLRDLVNVAENVARQQRVSTRGEEIIVNADPLEIQDLGPVLCQLRLQRRAWCDAGGRLTRAACQTELGCQADALHLTG